MRRRGVVEKKVLKSESASYAFELKGRAGVGPHVPSRQHVVAHAVPGAYGSAVKQAMHVQHLLVGGGRICRLVDLVRVQQ